MCYVRLFYIKSKQHVPRGVSIDSNLSFAYLHEAENRSGLWLVGDGWGVVACAGIVYMHVASVRYFDYNTHTGLHLCT